MLERLNHSMDHIEQHLDAEVEVAALARIALTSEYHYRRLFSALAGMPLSEYVRRRRLTLAGAEVLAKERTLLEIALRYGYGSGEAFARAFRAMHGIGPGEARQSGAALQSQPRISFRLIVEGSSSMQYRIVERGAFSVVGVKTRVPIVYEGMNPDLVTFIKGLGRETIERIEALSDGEPRGVVGVTVADDFAAKRVEGSEIEYYHAAVSSAEPPEGMTRLETPAGTWAVFESEGEFPLALQRMWGDVFAQWFPSNRYQVRPGPEILRTQLSEDAKQARAELWIPVDRAAV